MSTKNHQDSTIRRPIDQIEKQLADLTKIKQMAEEYGERDFASRAALKSIREHEQELREELAVGRAAEKQMPGNRKRVFILGAGFSKPAGMPDAHELTDALIERATLHGEVEEMHDWLESVKDRLRYLRNDERVSINVEELFHYAQFEIEIWRMKHQLDSVGRYDGETHWVHSESIQTWLSYLLVHLIDEIWEKQNACDLRPISRWAEHVRNDDVIITFNYDTLVEQALDRCGVSWTHGMPEEPAAGVKVLKLHGSLDWQVTPRGSFNPKCGQLLFRKENATLEADDASPHEVEDASDLIRVFGSRQLAEVISKRDFNCRVFGIAGLGTYKELHNVPGLATSWANAANALALADEIIVVGFAMSAFDAMARMVFADVMMHRAKSNPMHNACVTLISPDADQLKSDYKSVFRNVRPIAGYHEEFQWESLDHGLQVESPARSV